MGKITGNHPHVQLQASQWLISIPQLCSHQSINLSTLENRLKCVFSDVHYFHKQKEERDKKINIKC